MNIHISVFTSDIKLISGYQAEDISKALMSGIVAKFLDVKAYKKWREINDVSHTKKKKRHFNNTNSKDWICYF